MTPQLFRDPLLKAPRDWASFAGQGKFQPEWNPVKTSSRRLNCLPKVSGLKAPTRDQVSVSPHGLESAPLLEGTRASLSDLPKHWIKAPAPSLGLLGSLGSLSAGATLNVSSFIIGTVQIIKKYGSPTMIASRNVQVPDSHKGSRKP